MTGIEILRPGWRLGSGNSSRPLAPSATPGAPRAPRGLTCAITRWLAFLPQPRPSLHNRTVRKKHEPSPRAQPPALNELHWAVRVPPANPQPCATRPEVGPGRVFSAGRSPGSAQPGRCGRLASLQPRRTERRARPSPPRRVVFMAPSAHLC